MDGTCGWVSSLADQIQATKQVVKGSYAGFAALGDKVVESFGAGLDKLRKLKGAVDPENVFSLVCGRPSR